MTHIIDLGETPPENFKDVRFEFSDSHRITGSATEPTSQPLQIIRIGLIIATAPSPETSTPADDRVTETGGLSNATLSCCSAWQPSGDVLRPWLYANRWITQPPAIYNGQDACSIIGYGVRSTSYPEQHQCTIYETEVTHYRGSSLRVFTDEGTLS